MFDESRINITAHAGCMGTEMDSLEAVEAGIEYGADIIEIDLNVDENKTLLLCHDKVESGRVYVEFEDILTIIKKKQYVFLNVDIKNVEALDKLNLMIADYGLKDKVFFTGLTHENIALNKEKLKESKYFLNLHEPKLDVSKLKDKEYLKVLFKEFQQLNLMGININYKLVTPEFVSTCKENNLLCSVWTIDEVEDIKKMADLKVNSITTKRVDILKDFLERK